MNKLELMKVAAKYLRYLSERGYEVEVCRDFPGIPQAARETGRDYQLPTFDVLRTDHTGKTAFWLFLVSEGARIGGAAAILQDLGDECSADFLRRVADSQYPNENGSTLTEVAQPIGDLMSGRLAYIGELAFRREEQGQHSVLAAFMRLLQVLVLFEWDVDWSYAFIPDRHLRLALNRRYGFTRLLPDAQTWREPVPEKRSSGEWWVAATRKELMYFLGRELHRENIL